MMMIEDYSTERMNIYSFISRLFLEEPPKELLADLSSGRLKLPELPEEAGDDLREGLNMIWKSCSAENVDLESLYDDLCDDYIRLFIGPGSPNVSPYESSYTNTPTGRLRSDVGESYKQAGFSISEGFGEAKDHIAVELNFMHKLAGEKLDDAEKDTDRQFALQKEFLNTHLLPWVPDFCTKVDERARTDFYRGLARFLRGFIRLDADFLSAVG